MAKMPTICLCGNELQRQFRVICNEILQTIWQESAYQSAMDWKSQFNAVVCEHYGKYHWHKSGYFAEMPDLTMDMVRKLYRELNISV